jgi:hypothetical protein
MSLEPYHPVRGHILLEAVGLNIEESLRSERGPRFYAQIDPSKWQRDLRFIQNGVPLPFCFSLTFEEGQGLLLMAQVPDASPAALRALEAVAPGNVQDGATLFVIQNSSLMSAISSASFAILTLLNAHAKVTA